MSEALLKSLELLVFGWGGVFVVIFIIYLASILLSQMFPVKKLGDEIGGKTDSLHRNSLT